MKLAHYGYPSLERYPNTFFKEQLGYLEIAVSKYLLPKPVNPAMGRCASGTSLEKQLEWMAGQGKMGIWESCSDIEIGTGLKRKTVSANISTLRLKGYNIQVRRNCGKPEYLLVRSGR